MKRLIQTYALAMLLGAIGAHAAAQTAPTAVADPQAPVPAIVARPAIGYRAEPAPAARPDGTWRDANATVGGRNAMRLTMPAMPAHEHEHHAGMDMGAQQCTAGGCGGMNDAHGDHGAGMQGMQCKQGGGACGCCCHKESMHKEGT